MIIENKGPGPRSKRQLLAGASRQPLAIQQDLPALKPKADLRSREVFNHVVRTSNQQTVLGHLHPRSRRADYEGEV